MATDNKPKATQVRLGIVKNEPVRFSYLHVFKPHLNQESKKEEYSVQLLVPKTNKADYEALKAAVDEQQALYVKVDGKPGPEFHNPLKDGDALKDKKGNPKPIPGFWVVSAKTMAKNEDGTDNDPPGVVGTEKDTDGQLKPLTSKQIKSGDWGRASINVKFFTKGKGGIGVYLNNLQKTKDGDALGSRKSASDEFGDYEDDDQDDPLS